MRYAHRASLIIEDCKRCVTLFQQGDLPSATVSC